ncbi:stage III sporulation protein AF [Niallia endozanthoxylica]|uniref:Stage III sporulation protein AF n=1 Tax=Niallia endozanthoxylica TaxID=2036016 RepID=A0A5J5HV54_9BACI|nr:stage III sporulation protein AF [Niallia endozanthoxylica]KAA9026255.1 stage III sporulation protein AF [Niallia endozanthoxylica]
MEFIKEWVTNIILFVLFAMMIDMLLPNSKFQKYTKMVIGLLLIAIILTPIFKLISQEFETTMASIPEWGETSENQIKNLIDSQKNEIQASQDAYILKQMAVQLKEDAEEELMDQYGLVITDLNLLTDEDNQRPFPENLQKVVIQLQEHSEETEVVEAVKPVEINTTEPLVPEEKTENSENILQLLSQKWSIDEKVIELQIEGGGKSSE